MNYAAYYVPPLLVSSYYLLASILLISLGGLIILVSFCGCIGGCAVSKVLRISCHDICCLAFSMSPSSNNSIL